ncbi:type IV toxin-antitoxin system AbiEi family antitoxin domain-containing protein [Agromyces endophyticus]|uniref:type IV toxin-antitoxin system AbiEi family antitoxin domain-containing protein n=1 Tax=Agromyces sp. H17E-10 TaxID=2932244 RepID=UPI001FD379EB|nr:type IV toxin-antitoxin system AbiEi family antitoxin domain-containing protein [Agromyces sp. H17E-10]UOQ89554.1 type IV toxin-antitoxin system AbiEi family antitoxin domain-containing protein [Agromyces sp. H17E-10]
MGVSGHEVERWCDRLGGVARTSDLLSAGVDAKSIARAWRVGDIRRVRPGVYATPTAAAEVVTAARHVGMLGCVSRLRRAGVWLLDHDERVHVSMPAHGRRHPHDGCTCVLHWVGGGSGLGECTIVDALAHSLACCGVETFFAALESAMRKRLIDRAGVRRLRAKVPARHRPLVDFARWDADSGLESLLRLRLRAHRIELRSQVMIDGVGRVDFVLGDRLILEADGKGNHVDGFVDLLEQGSRDVAAAAASKRHKDLVRDSAAAERGYVTLRFDYAQIVHDWPRVEAAILASVAHGRHRVSKPGRSSRGRRVG